jgi:1-acyl-sn-glycerol-3-phosphate acyltransferase
LGRENIPRRGPVIVAANHLAVLDSFYLSLAARRQITFLAKREYFDKVGIAGGLQRWFFSALGQIPVDRRGGSTASPAIEAATQILERGGVWGIHPEGTRSPDGRLYRGRTGAVRVAIDTGVPLVPVAITGTRPDRAIRWWRRRVVIEILDPLDLTPFRDSGAAGVRAATDALMRAIGDRTGQQYVDAYAKSWTVPADQQDAA